MPISTQPSKLGAPLPEEDYSGRFIDHQPTEAGIRTELARAQIELMHAIARHRKAWSKARRHSNKAKELAIWADSHPPYKDAIADVRWWREEMTAQAATVTALTNMLRGF